VQKCDGLLRRLLVLELDEREPTRPAGLPVGGNLRVHHLAGGTEGFEQLLTRHVVAQVADEHLFRNGLAP
jgi:hypothetical protein